MKCKDCRWWSLNPARYFPGWGELAAGEEWHPGGACHRFPKTVEKRRDDFCGEFEERPEEELSEDERFKNSLKPTWDENNGDAAA